MKNNYFKEQGYIQAEQIDQQAPHNQSDSDRFSSMDQSQKSSFDRSSKNKTADQFFIQNEQQQHLQQQQDNSKIQNSTQNFQQVLQQQQQQQLMNTQTSFGNQKLQIQEEDQMDQFNQINKSTNQIFSTAVNNIKQMQSFTKRLQNVFNKQEQQTFSKLRDELESLMEQFDDKVVEALHKKEYELLKSFQITLEKMTKELHECQNKLNEFNLQVELDIKVIGLEKQLRFYRENSCSLNEENKVLKDEVAKLKYLQNELEQENLWSRQAHFKTQQKLNLVLESSNENLNTTKLSLAQKNNNLKISHQDFNTSFQESANNTLENFEGGRLQKQSRQFKYRDSLVAARKVIMLQENVHQAAHIVDELLCEKINPRDQLIEHLKEQVNSQKQLNKQLTIQLKNNNIPDPAENQIKSLFLRSIGEVQQEIQKRNKLLNTLNQNNEQMEIQKFTKFDRIEVISKFFSSLKFLEVIKAMLFDEKCCSNPKCKFNLHDRQQIEKDPKDGQNNLFLEDQKIINEKQETENSNIKGEISHHEYFHLINTHNPPDENNNNSNINNQNVKKLIPNLANSKSPEDTLGGQNNQNVNRLYQIKQRSNLSYYHITQNQNASNRNYKKNRSNSNSSTAYSVNVFGHNGEGQYSNLNSQRDQTFRSNGTTGLPNSQRINQSFENTLQEKDINNGEKTNESVFNPLQGYHKALKTHYLKQKQNQLEINDQHRKFHRLTKEADHKQQPIEPIISNLINTATSKAKSNPLILENINELNNTNNTNKIDKIIFKNNKIY